MGHIILQPGKALFDAYASYAYQLRRGVIYQYVKAPCMGQNVRWKYKQGSPVTSVEENFYDIYSLNDMYS